MPPLPQFRHEQIADLARQLRFAPKPALLRELERTESLAFELDTSVGFPLSYVVFRVTGYRAAVEPDTVIPGMELIGELATLAEHLSASAGIELDTMSGALSAEQLCDRWSVSRKSLERYRRRGLLSRRVIGSGGKPRIAYTPEAVAAFERREPETLRAAARFTRLEPELRSRIIEEARARAVEGVSLNQAALAIAERIGRGHETVRQILQQHDRVDPRPLFDPTGPMGPRDRRLCYRAWRRALEPGEIADHVGRPRAAVLRVVSDERAAVLRALRPLIARGLKAGTPDESAVRPETAQVAIGFAAPVLLEDLLALARGMAPTPAAEERRVLAACRELRRRAARALGELPEHGNSAPEIDQIETDLRWSARLKAEILRAQIPLVLRAVESRVGGPAEQLGSAVLRRVIESSLMAAADAMDGVHPSERGRLAAPVGLAVDRAVRTQLTDADLTSAQRPGRARRKVGSEAEIADFTLAAYPWQHAVEPDPRLRAALQLVGSRESEIIRLRYGYAPTPAGRPMTLREIADRLGSKPLHAARSERAAVRHALDAVRRAAARTMQA